jgi:hypothetical protein
MLTSGTLQVQIPLNIALSRPIPVTVSARIDEGPALEKMVNVG